MISCKSQSPVYTLGQSPSNVPNNSYIKDTNNILNNFVGNWKYESNGKTFIVNLQKIMYDLDDYYKDMLKGKYVYTDGITVINTNNYSINNSQITGATLWENNPNKVTLKFYDPERPKMSSKVVLTYSNINGIEKLHWDLKIIGKLPKLPFESEPKYDFRVPTNVELVKQ